MEDQATIANSKQRLIECVGNYANGEFQEYEIDSIIDAIWSDHYTSWEALSEDDFAKYFGA